MNIDDLMRDDSFWNWAHDADEKDCTRWERYFHEHPEEADTLLRAKLLVLDRPKPAVSTAHDVDEEWSVIRGSLKQHNRLIRRRRVLRISLAAACMALLIVAGYVLFINSPANTQLISHMTQPGEISTITLDDGTSVILNGNSRLVCPESFKTGNTRTVTLEGEAFFNVAHDQDVPFIVKSEIATTRVLGTEFNVRARANAPTIVSLLNGKVEVSGMAGKNTIVLSPGNTALIRPDGIDFVEEDVRTRCSWRDYVWIFSDTPLREVLQELEDTFGINSVVDTKVDLDKAISGKLSTRDPATLYSALEVMLGVQIAPHEKGIEISLKE